MPFTESGLYVAEERFFVNTAEFTRTGEYFKKNGVYTKAHPKFDKRDYDEFWDIEEERCLNGYTIGGVHITGEHYGFLNFNIIKRTTDHDEIQDVLKDRKKARKVGTKDLTLPDFWDGHYHLFHARKICREQGFNLIGNKGRRKGFSYIGGYVAAHNYNFFPNTTTLLGAFDKKYLTKGDGIMSMAKSAVHFFNKHTAWRKRRIKNESDHYKSGYLIGQEEHGFLSQILAVSFRDNADAAVGKDAYEIDLDEGQTFPNLREVLDMTLPTLEDGDIKTGFLSLWGTGGSKEANWAAFEYEFYNPKDNGFLAFDNIWDEGMKGTSCGFFFPHFQNLVPYVDENGNSDKVAAEARMDELREEKKANSTPDKYLNYIAQRPKNPREAFTNGETNFFVSNELLQHVARVRQNKELTDRFKYGELLVDPLDQKQRIFTYAELQALGLKANTPLLNYPLKNGQDPEGCFVEFFPIYRDPKTGKIPKNLYRIWVDPYAFNKEKDHITGKDSLGACYVFERPNLYTPYKGDVLVACYVGRPEDMDVFNGNLVKICQRYGMYDGMLMFENDRGDTKNFFEKVNLYHILADEPDVDWNKQLTVTKTGRDKGISIGSNIGRKGAGALYYKNWLYTKRGVDSAGNPIYNFHYIFDLGLLEETIKWNLKGNFDRVSCMFVGMFDKEEQFHVEIRPPKVNNPKRFFARAHYRP